MRIVNICRDDYANYCYTNALALKSVGTNCDSYKLQTHAFNYPNQATVVSIDAMHTAIAHADVVQLFHNDVELFQMCLQARQARTSGYLRILAYHSCFGLR